jgi:predicted nucleic acid-binding protein
MVARNRRIFLDTSVIFAAVLSETGGARKLFRLGEIGLIQLVLGPSVLRECEAVVQRKAPASLPALAQLLDIGRAEIAGAPGKDQLEKARKIVAYEPDALVLAEAIGAEPVWFITHDKAHFLDINSSFLNIRIGTPGDLIEALGDEFSKKPPSA